MCHSARCGCYFGGDCNDGEKSRSEIKEKIQKLQDYLGWKEMYMTPDSRKRMEGRVAAMEWSAYRTKKAVEKQLNAVVESNKSEVLDPYTEGYFFGLRWVLGW